MPAPAGARSARTVTPPPIPAKAASRAAIQLDSSPEMEIEYGDGSPPRGPRDTAVDHVIDDAVPSMIGPDATIPSDSLPRFADAVPARPGTASRPPSHGAAALPPVRPPSRPAVTPPAVVSRALPPDPAHRDDSQAIEIYSPSPPSAEPPPGERSERPGQYSVRRKEIASQDTNVPLRERTGRQPVPAGLGRPRPPGPGRSSSSSSSPTASRPNPSDGVPRAASSPAQSDGVPQAAVSSASARSPHLTAPIVSRTGTGGPSSGPAASGNVVMTRPAVIVGAPPKPPGTPVPSRVRKAREDEGRGFGQGLISEKSLDEVILAYLSEDADEK